MRKLLIAGAAALVLAIPAAAEDWDFVLVNATGKPLKGFELSPAGAETWKKNILEEDVKRPDEIKPGARTTIRFDKDPAKCSYDLKVTFADATTAVWTKLNVCDYSFFTISYANGTPTLKAM